VENARKQTFLVSLQARYRCLAYSFLKSLTPQKSYKPKEQEHNILL